ncbi:hypothetical protein [Dankookia sp. P2]|uniref:hypothetical protein n=1 Tax=Dankookia sp. P2 TaxID=3423955 RepID=UPI003D6660C1
MIRAVAMAFEPSRLHALLTRQDLPVGSFVAIADGNRRIVATSVSDNAMLVGAPIPATAAKGRRGAPVASSRPATCVASRPLSPSSGCRSPRAGRWW